MADDLTRPYVGYRSAGRRPESQQDRAGAREAPLAALRGFASGVLGAPGDIESLVRLIPGLERSPTLSDLVRGTQPDATVLPTSEDVERRLPGRAISQSSPTGRAFTGAGQLAGGFYGGPGSPLRAVAALPGAVKKAGRDFVMAAGVPSSNVIKNKGGNWRADSTENAMDFMKFSVLNEQGLANLAERAGPQAVAEYMADFAPKIAANQWLDTKLAKYIRNEMGTPEDPIRALADRGVVSYELPPMYTYDQRALMEGRTQAGFPAQGLATTPLGRQWEAAADYAIAPHTAGELAANRFVLESNPWAANLPPDTPVYGVKMSAPASLGFRHVVDQLLDAMNPETTLPAALRLAPEKLQKVSVPQAYELTDKINKYREAEAAAAERAALLANTQATPRMADEGLQLSFVNKPGGAWVDIPEVVDEKGVKLCTGIGKSGGWCTQEAGYAKTYGSGDNRLVALLDAEGRPHAQAKITTNNDLGFFEAALQRMTAPQRRAFDEYTAERGGPLELDEALNWMRYEAPEAFEDYQRLSAAQRPPAPNIDELKPPGNSFTSERAEEYAKRDPQYKAKVTDSVLRFLNGGEWGRVKDLYHYDIVDLQDSNSVVTALVNAYEQPIRLVSPAFNAAVEANPQAPRFMTTRQLREFIGPIEDAAPAIKPGPEALGRAVDEGLDFEPDVGHPANNPARPRYNDGDIEEYARGGAVTRPDTNDYDAATIDALAQRLAEEIYG